MSYGTGVTHCPKCGAVGTYQITLTNGGQVLTCNRCRKIFTAEVKQRQLLEETDKLREISPPRNISTFLNMLQGMEYLTESTRDAGYFDLHRVGHVFNANVNRRARIICTHF